MVNGEYIITFRKAHETDIDALAKLRIDMLFGDTPHELSQTIRNNTQSFTREGMRTGTLTVYIAECGGVIAGMGYINFFSFPPNDLCPVGTTSYIGNMYTVPQYRRRGIAAHILELLIGESKRRGCERVLLYPTGEGKPLYEKAGFSPWGDAMVKLMMG